MSIKLIATDMDGTLLRDDRTFDNEKMTALLDEMDARGIRFVAASGNQYAQLQHYFEGVGTERLTYVSDNGALVIHDEQILAESALTADQINEILTWNAEMHPIEETLVMLSGNHGAYLSNHATPAVLAMASEFYPEVHQVEKFSEIDDTIFRVSLVWDQNRDVQPFLAKIRDTFGSKYHVTGSGFGSIDILPPNTNKRTGLSQLAKLWDIDPRDMVAFGDNDNDLEMLDYVGHPFVMPNAEPFMQAAVSQKAVADNNHDGVLDTIAAVLAADASDV